MFPTTHLTAAQRADIHARARRQAQSLRRAAVTDFWQGVYHFGANTVRAALHLLRRTANSANTTTTHTITPTRNPSGV